MVLRGAALQQYFSSDRTFPPFSKCALSTSINFSCSASGFICNHMDPDMIRSSDFIISLFKDPFGYCYQCRAVFSRWKKTPSYLTLSSGTGVIDERTEVIIGVGIDHRMQNRYWSGVLILMAAVDEVKGLAVPIGRWVQEDDSVSRLVFIEGLRRLSGGLCKGSDLWCWSGSTWRPGIMVLTFVWACVHVCSLTLWPLFF